MNILGLFLPIFSGSKDEYGKDIIPPLPLSIDRVMENQPLRSTAPVLQLPSDVLSIILSLVEADSLSSLSLVNSDCRQLARSRQFASICFDYSNQALDLIDVLLNEKDSRSQSSNVLGGIGAAIGPCIRRITVATNPVWIKNRHDIELSEEFNALEQTVRDERIAKASKAFSKYLRRIESILSSRATLPHLELLDWEDRVPLQQSFFNSLTTSSIQHLKLFRVSVDQEFDVVQPQVSNRWNLRTLNMDIVWSLERFGQGTASQTCSSLLRSCSHSIETLVWHQTGRDIYTFGTDPANVPRFEQLRKLGLRFIRFADSGIVDALLEPPLSVLDLKYCSDRVVVEALRNRGRIQSLETFLISLSKFSIDSHLEFLKENKQITKLTILGGFKRDQDELPGDTPEAKILAILSSSFKALKSLRLIWNATVTSIPDAGLAIISTLATLEQVCLGAGCQHGWKYDWLIDHESMRRHLSLLPALKKIAFMRDSYLRRTQSGEDTHETYYSDRWPLQEEIDAARLSFQSPEGAWEQTWEDGHKRRMVAEARKYAALMPKLEWIYVGQYPMDVMKGQSGGQKQAIPLSDERDDCLTLLNRMFGWEGLGTE